MKTAKAKDVYNHKYGKKINFEDLEKGYYYFDRVFTLRDKKLSMIGKIIKISSDNIHILPVVFIHGEGDVTDIREFNKAAYNNFYNAHAVTYKGQTQEDYPEYFL